MLHYDSQPKSRNFGDPIDDATDFPNHTLLNGFPADDELLSQT